VFRPLCTRKSSRRRPHVAVIVPCYNYGHYLVECIKSIVSQDGVSIKVLIIDDASTDESFLVAERLSERLPQVSAVRHERNRGHIATYNDGLSQADSDYVALLSADDLLAAGSLARATALMDDYPSTGMTYGRPMNFVDSPMPDGRRVWAWSVWAGHRWIDSQCKRGLGIIYSPEAVVRTSVQHEVGYYSGDLPHSADLEMWLRIASVSDIGRVHGPVQAYRRVHAGSMMQSAFADPLTDMVERYKAFESFFSRLDELTPSLDHSWGTIRRRLSEEAFAFAHQTPTSARQRTVAIDFARDIDPDFESSAGWRELSHDQEQDGRILNGQFFSWRLAKTRELRDRVRWRRWRYLGL
jgi:glycosyltransferase involved in cell wall biosynthesis